MNEQALVDIHSSAKPSQRDTLKNNLGSLPTSRGIHAFIKTLPCSRESLFSLQYNFGKFVRSHHSHNSVGSHFTLHTIHIASPKILDMHVQAKSDHDQPDIVIPTYCFAKIGTAQASVATDTLMRCHALLAMPLMFQMGATLSG